MQDGLKSDGHNKPLRGNRHNEYSTPDAEFYDERNDDDFVPLHNFANTTEKFNKAIRIM